MSGGGTLLAVSFLFSFAYAQLTNPSEQLPKEAIENISVYGTHGENKNPEQLRERAQQEFGRHGPALAQYFLHHQTPPDNSAFFFLFETVGNAETASILIHAIPNAPTPVDSVVPRHPGEIEVAVESILHNASVRSDPAVLQALEETLVNARQLPWGGFPAERIIALMGQVQTPEAVEILQGLANDSDPAIRTVAVGALGQAGQSPIQQVLRRTLRKDPSPAVRAEAAEALAQTPTENSVHFLLASLEKETDLQVIDSILGSLVSLQFMPEEPEECLRLSKMGWDVEAIKPYFHCWQKTAFPTALIHQATSGPWAVRALALKALTQRHPPPETLTLKESVDRHPLFLDEETQTKLLESAVIILSQEMRGSHSQETISHELAYMTKEAFWEISGNDMATALAFADRIQPLYGRYDYIGRFGASAYLASQNTEAYTAMRRPGQLLSAAFLALGCALMLIPSQTRKFGTGVLAGIALWVVFMMVETGVQVFPPPPLWMASVLFLAFLSAGIVSGGMTLRQSNSWRGLLTSPIIAGLAALIICAFTRWQGLFPIGEAGWSLFFDPVGAALLAAFAAFLISLSLLLGMRILGRFNQDRLTAMRMD